MDASLLKQVEQAVGTAESGTAAEIVVVVAARAALHHVADLAWGGVAAALTLAFLLGCPWEVADVLILPDTAIAFFLGAFVSRQVPSMQRLFVSAEQSERALADAAKIAFHDHAVSATTGRTGVLVYFAEAEGRLVILPDLAIQGKVPGAVFNRIAADFAASVAPAVERLATAVRAVGTAVAPAFPRAADDRNELPDTPRVQA